MTSYETMLMNITDAMCEWEKQVPDRIHHFLKVHAFARQIALHEGMTGEALFTLEAAALVHDIGIKPAIAQTGACAGPVQEKLGADAVPAFLAALDVPQPVIDRVTFLVGHHHTTTGVDALDWRILLEADYLVNMIEGKHTAAQIDAFKANVFRTQEGLKLIELVRPEH